MSESGFAGWKDKQDKDIEMGNKIDNELTNKIIGD
jgi:hypothetical protein